MKDVQKQQNLQKPSEKCIIWFWTIAELKYKELLTIGILKESVGHILHEELKGFVVGGCRACHSETKIHVHKNI